jgi:hypothetical protein
MQVAPVRQMFTEAQKNGMSSFEEATQLTSNVVSCHFEGYIDGDAAV